MKTSFLAIALSLIAQSTFAAPKMSAGCQEGIRADLEKKGYTARDLHLVRTEKGSCDGETCNPDWLKLHVEAETATGHALDLIVEAIGPSRGDDWCRVFTVKVAR